MNHNIYISALAKPDVKKYLQQRLEQLGGLDSDPPGKLIEIPPSNQREPAVSSHADLYHCIIGDRILSGCPVGNSYPFNIGFNGVHLGSFFIHNFRYTDPSVLAEIERLNLRKIHVNQGYTKCNITVVDSSSVITSDRGIAKALSHYPIDLLQIDQSHVLLPGFPYGFLGGASGLVGNEVVFHGDLRRHPDFHRIFHFISERQREPIWFDTFPLTDIGSIITLL